MGSHSTRTIPPISWDPRGAASEREVPHFVIAWSREEGDRIGEAAPVTEPSVLGRDHPTSGDGMPLLRFCAQRPSDWPLLEAPLRGSVISRRHLILTPLPDGAVGVNCEGRRPLLLHGHEVEEGIVRPGDTMTLEDALVLLVVSRRPRWFQRTRCKAHGFPFGAADEHGIVGESPAAWALRDALEFAGEAGRHVLVHGESGAGKELAARAIHALSPRHRGPFVARNAATLPEGLVDAELFGHAPRYPHPTSEERRGLIGEADGGTLFLDEIGELPHDLQAHLLRVLDGGGEYQRLGDKRARWSNFRLVAATNRPVSELKHDLAARLVSRVEVPGLGQRREDVPLLLRHLLAGAMRDNAGLGARYLERPGERRREAFVEPQLIEALLRHEYTHHTRELSLLMWTALESSKSSQVALTEKVLEALRRRGAAPEAGAEEPARGEGGEASSGGPKKKMKKRTIGRAKIEAALRGTGGKVTPASRALGLKNRYVLLRLMKRLGIGDPEDSGPQG
ncbi:MAG: sigma-54-dependent Fis family transcriptional regulator [Polyangiaceae bacterium]|nr:sigma-54-dependent Fis family transcriptional regulator [Polyangiaceae bacterium]